MTHYLAVAGVAVLGLVGYLLLTGWALIGFLSLDAEVWPVQRRILAATTWLGVTILLVALVLHDMDAHPEHWQRHYTVTYTTSPSPSPRTPR